MIYKKIADIGEYAVMVHLKIQTEVCFTEKLWVYVVIIKNAIYINISGSRCLISICRLKLMILYDILNAYRLKKR